MNPTPGISGPMGELGHFPLGDDSPKWHYFGLVPPVGPDSLAPPDSVSIHQRGANSAAIGWAAYPGAIGYRPFKQVEGVDLAPLALALTSQTNILFEALPAKTTVKFYVESHNVAGEARRVRRWR
jgi:hypothetical protein